MLVSRRRFLATGSFAATAAWVSPRSLFAQTPAQPDVVIQGRASAATAKITTQALRGNVSVLMGSGGNIAVLPGPEGKLIVDSGISTSRPQITEALERPSSRRRTPASASPPSRASAPSRPTSHRHPQEPSRPRSSARARH